MMRTVEINELPMHYHGHLTDEQRDAAASGETVLLSTGAKASYDAKRHVWTITGYAADGSDVDAFVSRFPSEDVQEPMNAEWRARYARYMR
jgi:hypothetical protein